MKPMLTRLMLPLTVFLTGGCILIIEVVAIRILSPYFGNTIYSVSSVISVVLAALSVGYYVGGRLADKHPDRKLFFGIIALSGLVVLLMQLAIQQLLPQLGYWLPLDIGPLVAACLFFFAPGFILGLVSPFAIALQQRTAKGQGVGTTAGEIFFFSTIGSIAGSLLAGFVLIPLMGIDSIIVAVGVVLFLLGIIPMALFGLDRKATSALVVAAGLVTLLVAVSAPTSSAIYMRDGLYEKITIFDGMYNGRHARFLQQDTSHSAAAYLGSDELPYQYTRYYRLHEMFTPQVDTALVIGGGAYSIPKALLADSPDVQVTASEIEPSLVPLAKEYFDLKDDPRLTHVIADGRRALHDTPERYDLIFGDAYHSMYSIPSHMTTREFMQLVSDRLTPEGVFIANLIGSVQQTKPSFIWSEIRTMQQVFPQVYLFAVQGPDLTEAQNLIAVGSMQPNRIDVNDPAWRRSESQIVREAALHHIDTTRLNLNDYAVLTDNHAPVDALIAKVLPKR